MDPPQAQFSRMDPRFLYPHPLMSKLPQLQADVSGPFQQGRLPSSTQPPETDIIDNHDQVDDIWAFQIRRKRRTGKKRLRRRVTVDMLWFLAEADASEASAGGSDAPDAEDDEHMVAEALFDLANMASRMQQDDEEGQEEDDEGDEEQQEDDGEAQHGPRASARARASSKRTRRRSPGDEDPDYRDHRGEEETTWRGRGARGSRIKSPAYRGARQQQQPPPPQQGMGEEEDTHEGQQQDQAGPGRGRGRSGRGFQGTARGPGRPQLPAASPEPRDSRLEEVPAEAAAAQQATGTGRERAQPPAGSGGRAGRGFEPPDRQQQQQQQPPQQLQQQRPLMPPHMSPWGMPLPMAAGPGGIQMLTPNMIARLMGQLHEHPHVAAATMAAAAASSPLHPNSRGSSPPPAVKSESAADGATSLTQRVCLKRCAMHVKIAHYITQQQQRKAASERSGGTAGTSGQYDRSGGTAAGRPGKPGGKEETEGQAYKSEGVGSPTQAGQQSQQQQQQQQRPPLKSPAGPQGRAGEAAAGAAAASGPLPASGPPSSAGMQQAMAHQGMPGFPFGLPPQMMMMSPPQQQGPGAAPAPPGPGLGMPPGMPLPMGAMPRPGPGGGPPFAPPFMMPPPNGGAFPFPFAGVPFPGAGMPSGALAAASAAAAGSGGVGPGGHFMPFPFAGMQWPPDAEQLARMQGMLHGEGGRGGHPSIAGIMTALGNQQEAARRAAESRR